MELPLDGLKSICFNINGKERVPVKTTAQYRMWMQMIVDFFIRFRFSNCMTKVSVCHEDIKCNIQSSSIHISNTNNSPYVGFVVDGSFWCLWLWFVLSLLFLNVDTNISVVFWFSKCKLWYVLLFGTSSFYWFQLRYRYFICKAWSVC